MRRQMSLLSRQQHRPGQILDSATEDANSIQMGRTLRIRMRCLQSFVFTEHSINDNKEKYNSLISDLENVLSVVNNNRNELNVTQEEPEQEPEEVFDADVSDMTETQPE